MDLLCFSLVVSATVLFVYFCFEALKCKSSLFGANPNPKENFRITQFGEPEFRDLSVLYAENCDLKKKILLAAKDLANLMTERNKIASQRDEFLSEVRDWKGKYDLYTLAITNTLKEYKAQREKYEKEKEELVSSMLEVRDENEAGYKVKFQVLQAALTTEHLRSTASLNQELQVRSELQRSKSRIAELELINANQSKRIAKLESSIASFGEQYLGKASKDEEADKNHLITKKIIRPEIDSLTDETEPDDFKVVSEIVEEELEEEYIQSMIAARDYSRIIGPKGEKIKDLQDVYGDVVLTSLPQGSNDKVRVTITNRTRNNRYTARGK